MNQNHELWDQNGLPTNHLRTLYGRFSLDAAEVARYEAYLAANPEENATFYDAFVTHEVRAKALAEVEATMAEEHRSVREVAEGALASLRALWQQQPVFAALNDEPDDEDAEGDLDSLIRDFDETLANVIRDPARAQLDAEHLKSWYRSAVESNFAATEALRQSHSAIVSLREYAGLEDEPTPLGTSGVWLQATQGVAPRWAATVRKACHHDISSPMLHYTGNVHHCVHQDHVTLTRHERQLISR